jgi:hypothetical protein
MFGRNDGTNHGRIVPSAGSPTVRTDSSSLSRWADGTRAVHVLTQTDPKPQVWRFRSVPGHGSPAGRSEYVGGHVTPAEASAIRALAAEADRSVSSEVRRAILFYLASKDESPAAVGTGRGSKDRVAARRGTA